MQNKDYKYIIDANVPILAGTPVKDIPSEQLQCFGKCVEFLEKLIKSSELGIVVDLEGRILKEYRNVFDLMGCPNIATEFYKWVLCKMSNPLSMISLEEISENEFRNYPDSEKLRKFDPSDRKYLALAYNHPEKPPIVEATDSKWWGIKEEMNNYGLTILFVDEEYIKAKYIKKFSIITKEQEYKKHVRN